MDDATRGMQQDLVMTIRLFHGVVTQRLAITFGHFMMKQLLEQSQERLELQSFDRTENPLSGSKVMDGAMMLPIPVRVSRDCAKIFLHSFGRIEANNRLSIVRWFSTDSLKISMKSNYSIRVLSSRSTPWNTCNLYQRHARCSILCLVAPPNQITANSIVVQQWIDSDYLHIVTEIQHCVPMVFDPAWSVNH